jgi:predicted aspartyl protease
MPFRPLAARLRAGLRAGLVALALGGCQTHPTPAHPCDFTRLIIYNVSPAGKRLLVPLTIGHQQVPVEFDTGADRTVLTEETAQALGLVVDAAARGQAFDSSGAAFPVHLAALHNGHLVPGDDIEGKIAVAGHSNAALGGVPGRIGLDLLSHFDLDLDLPHHRVSLYRPRSCPARPPDLGGVTTELPQIHPTTGRKPPANTVGIEVDGVAQYAMIDTGAGYTTVDRKRAELLGVSAANSGHDLIQPTITPSGKVVTNAIHTFTTLKVGDEITPAPQLRIADLPDADHSGNNQMLLGLDYLRHHRVWISFAGAAVYASRWREMESLR